MEKINLLHYFIMKQIQISQGTNYLTYRNEIITKYFNDVSRQRKNDNKDIFDQTKKDLVINNLKFAISVAKKMCSQDTELSDLIQCANIGMVRAANDFDPTKGFKFITFAVKYMISEINNYKRENHDQFHRNSYFFSRYAKFLKEKNLLMNQYGCEINDFSALNVLGYDKNIVLIDGLKCNDICSISDRVYNDFSDVTYECILTDTDLDCKDNEEYLRYKLMAVLNKLPKKQRDVIIDYFFNNLSKVEISAKYHITQACVRERINNGLKKLKIYKNYFIHEC